MLFTLCKSLCTNAQPLCITGIEAGSIVSTVTMSSALISAKGHTVSWELIPLEESLAIALWVLEILHLHWSVRNQFKVRRPSASGLSL